MRTYSAASNYDTRATLTTVHITEVTRRQGGSVTVQTMCGTDASAHGQVGWHTGRSLFTLGLPDSFFRKCGRCARTRGTNVERYEMTRAAERFGNLSALVETRTPDTLTVVQDDTGDTLVEWHGCVVGARFTTGRDATAFLSTRRTMADRPERCTRPSGGYGACVRQAGHPAECADAHGYRFTFPTEDEKRAASMAAHPAGKGRTRKIIGRVIAGGLPVVRPIHRDADGGMVFACDRIPVPVDSESERALDEDADRFHDYL